MPECVEIYTTCLYLNERWKGKLILKLSWDERSKFRKTGIKGIDLIKFPCRVIGVFPRGKLIIIECRDSNKKIIYMISQLGMEGKWVHHREKHSNFKIYFGEINSNKTKYEVTDRYFFVDSRHFGNFSIHTNLFEIEKSHGPCFLTTALVNVNMLNVKDLKSYQTTISLEEFTKKIINKRIKNKQICEFLLEQKYGSGIGNYLRSEIFYRARIDPKKELSSFSSSDIELLYDTIMNQLLISLGFSKKDLKIRPHWNPEKGVGICKLQVYSRSVDPLGNIVEKFKDKNGRTVHWVPSVLKIL